MRRRPLKFHAIAIGLICLIVIVLYFLIGPKNDDVAFDPNAPTGDRFIRIINASWGLNCNSEITRLRTQGTFTVTQRGKTVDLKPVVPGNATYVVSEKCNDKLTCSMPATNDVLDLDPLPACFKQLAVAYRCFSIDRQWKEELDQGELLQIDCNEAADKERKK